MKKVLVAAGLLVLIGLPACRRSDMPMTPAGETPARTLYHCAMHPQIVREKPGDCPICGMRLVPFTASGAAATPTGASNAMLPAGQAAVTIDSDREQLIGVKIATVEKRPLEHVIRAAARVAYDPGLYSAILEHQQAVAAQRQAAGASEEIRSEAAATVAASKLRLRQMGLSDAQIKRFGESSEPPANLLLGESGGTLWVYADLFDYEAGLVHPGALAVLTTPAFPGRAFQGRVHSIDTVLNSDTRTLRARIEVDNPDNALKPEMYLTAEIHASLGEQLAVPSTAILDTGDRKIVYVAKGSGHYEPREVQVGREADGYTAIQSGLMAGDRVVATANFFIDSESKFQGAAGMAP